MEKENVKISGGYALICAIWGSTWLAIRIGLDSLTPMIAVGLRFVLASLFIFVLMRLRKIPLQTDRFFMKFYIALAFFSYSIPFILVYWAEQFVSSGLASVLFTVFPFFVIIFSRLAIPEEEVDFFKVIGSILGFGGIVVIFADDMNFSFSEDLLGMLALLLSASMQAAVAVAVKKYGKNLNPLSMNLLPFFIGGIVAIIAAFIFEDSSKWTFDSKAVLSISYLAFFGTLVTFTTYYWLLKRMNVVILALSSFITPIIALFLGWLVLNETFSLLKIVGTVLVLIGILFANFKGIYKYYRLRTS